MSLLMMYHERASTLGTAVGADITSTSATYSTPSWRPATTAHSIHGGVTVGGKQRASISMLYRSINQNFPCWMSSSPTSSRTRAGAAITDGTSISTMAA